MIPPNPARRAALLSTFSAAVLAACGGGTDSPPAPVPTPSVPPTGDSILDALVFTRDFTPGVIDSGGNYIGGTETSALVGHRGKLYAGMGFWKDTPGTDPLSGAQVLVKDSVGAAWRLDLAFNEYALFSTEALASIEFSTDIDGRALNPPVRLLMASASYPPDSGAAGSVWIRDDNSATWTRTLQAPQAITARVIFSHIDAVTGVHHVFAGMRNGTIYRGAYDESAPGRVRWSDAPEVTSSSGLRFLSATVANGRAYAASGVANSPSGGVTGGLYERVDGLAPSWRIVYQWPVFGDSTGLRGLTAVPDPAGGPHEVLLATRDSEGVVLRIDPLKAFAATVEINYRSYYTQLWGSLGGNAALSAYNDMPRIVDPASGEPVWLIGLWINHPQRTEPPNNGSYYMVRHADGRYEHGRVFDVANPVPRGNELRATRTIVASPFAGDAAGALYFGGFDAGGDLPTGRVYHNTSWIYRGAIT
jgi:hypothetical protein